MAALAEIWTAEPSRRFEHPNDFFNYLRIYFIAFISLHLFHCIYFIAFNTILLYIGFFNTGAYQETIGGYGGLSHCILPQPKHILIDKDKNGIFATEVFSEQQKVEQVLEILGYNKNKNENK